MSPFRTVLVAVVAAALPVMALSAGSSTTLLPHLKLKKSFPAKDTVLTSSPDAVRLWLTEKSDLPATKITVTNGAAAVVPTAKPTRETAADAPVEARFTQPLTAGRYAVSWKTMSKDGHVVSGTFAFTVKVAP